ncbi:hypothetical protein I4000191A8_08180 [Clostridia bacterium i40-0019-1A8]
MKQHRPIKPANWIPAILLFLSIFLLLLAQNLPAFAEWYATGPYRVLSIGETFLPLWLTFPWEKCWFLPRFYP